MTISIKTKNNLIDVGIIVVATFISIYLLPAIAGLFVALSIKLYALKSGRTFFFIQYTILCHFLPSILTGILQGIVTMKFIRNCRLFVAILPAILLIIFYVLYFSFYFISPSGIFWWLNTVVVVSWILLLCSSVLGASLVLKRRKNNTKAK
ncbi:MAG: hypothetical protein PHW62_02330 [Candidatus Ratteibacteria bacterium]|nr:hypothetical protein [Candidatus Ratteibacteria bacterium]